MSAKKRPKLSRVWVHETRGGVLMVFRTLADAAYGLPDGAQITGPFVLKEQPKSDSGRWLVHSGDEFEEWWLDRTGRALNRPQDATKPFDSRDKAYAVGREYYGFAFKVVAAPTLRRSKMKH